MTFQHREIDKAILKINDITFVDVLVFFASIGKNYIFIRQGILSKGISSQQRVLT